MEDLAERPVRALRRPVRTSDGAELVEIRLPDAGGVELRAGSEAAAAVQRWLGADLDLGAARAVLADDPVLGPWLAERPGITVPGSVDAGELALRTVLGQQVSLAAAATFGGRLAVMLGEPVGDLRAFPTPAAIAAAGQRVREVGLTTARTRTVLALADALADGLDLGVDTPAARQDLAALPGIGPWTVEYVALRAMRDLDAFPAHDLVLRRRMGVDTPREAMALAERWRPWRGLAAQLLWSVAAG